MLVRGLRSEPDSSRCAQRLGFRDGGSRYREWLAVVALFAVTVGCVRPEPVQSNAETSVSLQNLNSRLVTIRIAFRTGSVNDPVGKNGLNALTLLMIGRGGIQTMTYDELTTALYPWAASIRTQSDKEMTTVIGQVHRDHLEPFYAILLELVLSPRLDPSDFERNKEFLTNAVVSNLRHDDDEALGKETLNVLMYEGHPYEGPTIGTELGLETITLDDVRTFYAQRYTRENLLLGIAGGYPNGFLARVEGDLVEGLEPGVAAPEPLPAQPILEGLEVLLVEKEAIATTISIGFPIVLTRADDDFYALLVATSYFDKHLNVKGLLMNRTHGDRGLNYEGSSHIENFIRDGQSRFSIANIPRRQQFFSIWIRAVPHHNAHFELLQALQRLEVLVTGGLSREDFEEARTFLLNYSKLSVQTASRRLGYLMDSRFYGTSFYIDEIQQRLTTLTVDDVNGAVRRHLQLDDLAIAIVTTDAEALRDRLLSNDTSPLRRKSAMADGILSEDEESGLYDFTINPERIRVVPVEEMFRTVS